MKFGKKLRAQMVQEWQCAYLDYNHLKKLLKDIVNQCSGPETGFPKNNHNVDEGTSESPIRQESTPETFQTMFFILSEEGRGESEGKFFERIDEEFNKVVNFYVEKVEEVKFRAENLSKQMDVLAAMRIKVESPKQGKDVVEEVEQTSNASTSGGDERIVAAERDENSIEILDHVKINVVPNTPLSSLRKAISRSSKADPSFSVEELKESRKKLRRAMVDFYQQLQLLKSYRLTNLIAFSKIMKKYDKFTSRNTSSSYLRIVDKSYIGSCDEVNRLIERVETIFVKQFAKGNRRQGMEYLRPQEKKERHIITFLLGLFTGCSIALLSVIIISVNARDLLRHEGLEQYMTNIYPLYSLFAYIVLHMILYGANTYFWRRYRVNYPLILGFKQGTDLGFREIFLLASGLAVLTFASVLVNLDMEMDPGTESFQILTELVPLGLLIVLLLITFFPFNIVYGSSRLFLIRCLWRSICAPLYMVTFSDLFLADQLTSQVQSIRSLQFYVCYYGWSDFPRRSNRCLESKIYEKFDIALGIIPFMIRLLQSLRMLFEEKSKLQGFNALKYFSTVVSLVMRTMYVLRRQTSWRIVAGLTSGITTIYSTYWDIVIDWGLLRKNAKNKWLRDNLLISNKAVYFVAIVVNILLRLVWMQLILDFNETPFLHRNSMVAIVACLEIIRRGIWNFFRLENEHFNNVDQFRAFKSVNLPFYYEDEKSV